MISKKHLLIAACLACLLLPAAYGGFFSTNTIRGPATISGGLTVSGGASISGGLTAVGGSSIAGGAVFNEAGADVDFRVEGTGAANALFVDGATGYVGIGTATPASKFQIVLATGGWRLEEGGGIFGANLICGAASNYITPGVGVGGSIVNGGGNATSPNYINGAQCRYCVVNGGYDNGISSTYSNTETVPGITNTISGGAHNFLTDTTHSAIGGGSYNTITGAEAELTNYAGILNGNSNSIGKLCSYSLICGGYNQTIANGSTYSVIVGGYEQSLAGDYDVIGGGTSNAITDDPVSATISGGSSNSITSNYATIGGGTSNTITSDSAALIGGRENSIVNASIQSTIGGGRTNAIGATGATQNSFIGGGITNSIVGGTGNNNSIVGGDSNSIATTATGNFIGGGRLLSIGSTTSYCAVLGGWTNAIGNSSDYSAIWGGRSCTVTGDYSAAFGRKATVSVSGAIALSDSVDATYTNATTNSMAMRFAGGWKFSYDDSNSMTLTVGSGGDVTVAATGGDISFSDENVSTTGNISAGTLSVGGTTGNTLQTTTLGEAATTLVVTKNVVVLTGHGSGNTLATITGGVAGQTLAILFADTNVTITDTDAHTANTVDISAAFTSADDATLQLLFDGTSWYEIGRSAN